MSFKKLSILPPQDVSCRGGGGVSLESLSSVCRFCLAWFLPGCVCAEHTILLLPSAHGVFFQNKHLPVLLQTLGKHHFQKALNIPPSEWIALYLNTFPSYWACGFQQPPPRPPPLISFSIKNKINGLCFSLSSLRPPPKPEKTDRSRSSLEVHGCQNNHSP